MLKIRRCEGSNSHSKGGRVRKHTTKVMRAQRRTQKEVRTQRRTQNWDTAGTYKATGKTQPHTFSGGMYSLREDHDLQAKFASLARKVEALELKKSGKLKSVQHIVCQICETNEHSTNDCPTLPSFKECLHEQAYALNSFQRLNHKLYS